MLHTHQKRRSLTAALTLLATIACANLHAQSLRWIGVPDTQSAAANDVANDGSVVGEVSPNATTKRAFLWRASPGMLYVNDSPFSIGRGVTPDGSVVVGDFATPTGMGRAFRWTLQTGLQDLGTLPSGGTSIAYDITPDGRFVVGTAVNATGRVRAVQFTLRGDVVEYELLHDSPNARSAAYAVSANGEYAAGYATNALGQSRAVRWEPIADAAPRDLGTLGGTESQATDISANGMVVVGWALNASGNTRAFRWQRSMNDLGTLGGSNSLAYGVSADGNTVVGTAQDRTGAYRAFRWNARTGIQDLNVVYANLLRDGSILQDAQAISPDGRYIVGYGYNAFTGRNEAFILDTRCDLPGDVNLDGIVDDADLLIVLFNFGATCSP